jgi:hypothetical protein
VEAHENLVGRDGIEPPTPGFSVLAKAETLGFYWTPLEAFQPLLWQSARVL